MCRRWPNTSVAEWVGAQGNTASTFQNITFYFALGSMQIIVLQKVWSLSLPAAHTMCGAAAVTPNRKGEKRETGSVTEQPP